MLCGSSLPAEPLKLAEDAAPGNLWTWDEASPWTALRTGLWILEVTVLRHILALKSVGWGRIRPKTGMAKSGLVLLSIGTVEKSSMHRENNDMGPCVFFS